jgi:hypothetical protein
VSAARDTCPQCGRPFEIDPANRYRPFCGARCHLLDLGAWLGGQRVLAGESVALSDQPPQDANGGTPH